MPKISKEALMKWRESENLKNPSKGEAMIQPKKQSQVKLPPPIRRPVRGSMKPANFSIIPDDIRSGEKHDAAPQKVYKEYRTGLLKKTYETISNNNKAFVDDCLNCSELQDLVENSAITQLDTLDGFPKLLLTVFSKYNIHSK